MLQLLDTDVWMCKFAMVIQVVLREVFSHQRKNTGYLLLLSEDSWNNCLIQHEIHFVGFLFLGMLSCDGILAHYLIFYCITWAGHLLSNNFLIIVVCKMFWRHISQNNVSYMKFCLSLFCNGLHSKRFLKYKSLTRLMPQDFSHSLFLTFLQKYCQFILKIQISLWYNFPTSQLQNCKSERGDWEKKYLPDNFCSLAKNGNMWQ